MPRETTFQTVSLIVLASLLSSASPVVSLTRNEREAKITKLTFTMHGAHCIECVSRLRAALKTLKGVKFRDEDVQPTEKPRRLRPRFFSPLFELSIADLQTTNIGAFAAAVKKVGTPHQDDVETGVNLILFPSQTIDEQLIMDFRSALRDVNGLEVDASGGLGGSFKDGYIWIRIEDAGGAALEDVLRAARGVDRAIRTTKKREQ